MSKQNEVLRKQLLEELASDRLTTDYNTVDVATGALDDAGIRLLEVAETLELLAGYGSLSDTGMAPVLDAVQVRDIKRAVKRLNAAYARFKAEHPLGY